MSRLLLLSLLACWLLARPSFAQGNTQTAIHRHFRLSLVDALVVAVQETDPIDLGTLLSSARRLELRDGRLNETVLALIDSDDDVAAGLPWIDFTDLEPEAKLSAIAKRYDRCLAAYRGGDGNAKDVQSKRLLDSMEKKAYGVLAEAERSGDSRLIPFLAERLRQDDVSLLFIKLAGGLEREQFTFLPRLVELATDATTVEARREAISRATRMLEKDQQARARARRNNEVFEAAMHPRVILWRRNPLNAAVPGEPDAEEMRRIHSDFAERIVARYDKNEDGQLSDKESAAMTIPPKGADTDGDGGITAAEYAAWLEKRK